MAKRVNYTEEMLALIYETGRAKYEQNTDIEKACRKAVELGMGDSQFRNYFVPAYSYLVEGKPFNRNLTLAIDKYLLQRIGKDNGIPALRKALDSYKATTEYYKSMGVKSPGRQAIIESMEEFISNNKF